MCYPREKSDYHAEGHSIGETNSGREIVKVAFFDCSSWLKLARTTRRKQNHGAVEYRSFVAV